MRLKTYVFIGLIRGFALFLKETTLHQTVLPLATSTSSGIYIFHRIKNAHTLCGRITNPPEQNVCVYHPLEKEYTLQQAVLPLGKGEVEGDGESEE